MNTSDNRSLSSQPIDEIRKRLVKAECSELRLAASKGSATITERALRIAVEAVNEGMCQQGMTPTATVSGFLEIAQAEEEADAKD